MPKISVIILNYNGQRFLGNLLGKCVESVLETDYPYFELLFVDNASTDNSIAVIKSRFGSDKRLKIIQNSKNLGFAEGNNVGLRLAQGTYIALLNSDTQVDSCWLKNLVKVIEPADVGAVQSKLLQMNYPNLMDSAGGFIDQHAYHHFEVGSGQEETKYNSVSEIFYAKGACMLLKREVLARSGLFDPKLFMYYDETDLCWRIRLSGYKILFAPTSLVWHLGPANSSKERTKKILYFSTRNHLAIILKNYSNVNMVKETFVTIIWEIRNTLKLILKRSPDLFSITIKALFWDLANFPYIWSQRQFVQKNVRTVSDREIKKVMLKTFPPFPLSLVYSRKHYFKE